MECAWDWIYIQNHLHLAENRVPVSGRYINHVALLVGEAVTTQCLPAGENMSSEDKIYRKWKLSHGTINKRNVSMIRRYTRWFKEYLVNLLQAQNETKNERVREHCYYLLRLNSYTRLKCVILLSYKKNSNYIRKTHTKAGPHSPVKF